jgi:hypothetical protein
MNAVLSLPNKKSLKKLYPVKTGTEGSSHSIWAQKVDGRSSLVMSRILKMPDNVSTASSPGDARWI